MLQKKIINLLRRIFPIDRYSFRRINERLKLGLDYSLNKDAVSILEDIFIHREYAAYFPFYEESTIIDIGAHYGYFSIFAAMNTDKKSRIIAVEPSSKNYEILKKNISATKISNIKPVHAALTSKSGEIELHQSKSFNHSLYPIDSKQRTEKVEAFSLLHFLEKLQIEQVDFLKIDCEGAEYPILLHSTKETLSKIKVISMEFHDFRQEAYAPQHLIQHLEKCGFEVLKYQFDSDYAIQNLNFGKLVMRRNGLK